MRYVLLVECPSGSWTVWAFADSDAEDGVLRTEGRRLEEAGRRCMIYLELSKP